MKNKIVAALFLAFILILVPGQFSVKANAAGMDNIISGQSDVELMDWNSAPERINVAVQSGDKWNVDVFTGYEMEVPVLILKQLAGKPVTLAMQTGDGLAVSISGRDVKSADKSVRMELSTEIMIPEEVSHQITAAASYYREFAMAEKVPLPMRCNVHLNMGQENAGKPVILYYYDEANDIMRLTGIGRVSSSGYAMFGLDHGDEYLAVVPYGRAYFVQEGDILGKIAESSGISLKALLKKNPQLSDADEIYPGQMIIVP
jgi:hypothetical protein